MKKIILFLVTLFIAHASYAADYSSMCAPKPYPVSNPVAQFASNITGTNFLLTKVAELAMQKELKKEFGSNFNVEIKAYGGKNFIDGKFKSMSVNSKNIKFEGLKLSSFEAKTLCDFNQVVLDKKNISFAQNLIMNYSAKLSAQDLKATVQSKEYRSALSKMDVAIGSKVLFKIFDPDASIANDRIKLKFKVMTPFVLTNDVSEVSVDAGLKVENEKIVFADVNLGSKNNRINLNKVLPLINRLNPLTTEFSVSDDAKGIFKIKTVSIDSDKILVDGVFILPKNCVNKTK